MDWFSSHVSMWVNLKTLIKARCLKPYHFPFWKSLFISGSHENTTAFKNVLNKTSPSHFWKSYIFSMNQSDWISGTSIPLKLSVWNLKPLPYNYKSSSDFSVSYWIILISDFMALAGHSKTFFRETLHYRVIGEKIREIPWIYPMSTRSVFLEIWWQNSSWQLVRSSECNLFRCQLLMELWYFNSFVSIL